MFSGKMEGRFRLFIARTKASNRCVHSSMSSTPQPRVLCAYVCVGRGSSVISFLAVLLSFMHTAYDSFFIPRPPSPPLLGRPLLDVLTKKSPRKRLHSRAANGVDGEPALPWLMAGGTMQHPVVLDEATATRLGYGASCVMAPAHAVRASPRRWGDDGVGDGRRRRQQPWPPANGGGAAAAAAAAATAATASDDGDEGASASGAAIPEVGGYFRMWSNYRMALEGHATGVQVGTLLPPVLDMARTVADSFRRRWAAGGQYPERVLARVRLAEGGNGRAGGDGDSGSEGAGSLSGEAAAASVAAGGGGGLNAVEVDARAREAGVKRDAERRWREIAESASPPGGRRRRGEAASGREGDKKGGSDDLEVVGGRDGGEGEGSEEDQQDAREQPPSAGLRQVLSRLDGLDSGALVERALEDHLHGEGGQADAPSDAAAAAAASEESPGKPPPGGDQNGPGRGLGTDGLGGAVEHNPTGGSLTATAGPDDDAEETDAPVAAAGVGTSTLTRPQDADTSSESGRDGGAAAAAAAAAAGVGIQTPAEEKFMLPGWHYLALSGRTLSMDFRWTDMDLVLMQDPTARLGRDTGKNVLALRSSGALTVSSSGVGESVDVQLRDASLLPCFYTNEAAGSSVEGGLSSSGASRRNGSGRSGDGGGPAQRLALILGGGERPLAAVDRTWLGQGLVTAGSRPLLEPFTLQFGYGTVVARAAPEGRGTDVMDGRYRRSSALSGGGYQDSEAEREGEEEEEDDGGGLVVPSPAMRGLDGEEDGTAEGSMHEDGAEKADKNRLLVDQQQPSIAGEFVHGVFRVAVSEVRLLGGARRTSTADNEVATVEIMVRKSPVLSRLAV